MVSREGTAARPMAVEHTPVPLRSVREQMEHGRSLRHVTPRSMLSHLSRGDRDPLGILTAQNATRLSELVPLRIERMSASPFAFFRGTAAIQAADLASEPHSGILVASCGDAHISNFGFYASPQRSVVFDLNDFDEAAGAPWEWDVKRLLTSIVLAGQESSRDETVVRNAARAAVRAYALRMAAAVERSPIERYFEHFDAETAIARMDKKSRAALRAALRDARKRTGDRATRRLTTTGSDGRLAFVERPPTMTRATPETEARLNGYLAQYLESVNVDIRVLLRQYRVSDRARRVVGIGSVGTRCALVVLEDGDGNGLVLQVKQAGRSVLVEYGGMPQAPALERHIAQRGEGGRVVAMQRILQAVSDPFLGYLQADEDFYVRQFHDMKGGVVIEALDDAPFHTYARACAVTLARAHSQSEDAAVVAGYIGSGRAVSDALVDWAFSYAERSRADHAAFIAAHGSARPGADSTPRSMRP